VWEGDSRRKKELLKGGKRWGSMIKDDGPGVLDREGEGTRLPSEKSLKHRKGKGLSFLLGYGGGSYTSKATQMEETRKGLFREKGGGGGGRR